MNQPPPPPLPNPYVGPHAIQRGQALYGRDQDLRRLVEMLIVNRLVLLHSTSGAGKTSLIQAGLLPKMEKRQFWLPHPEFGARMNFTTPQPTLVTQALPTNPFRLSLLVTLEEGLAEGKRPPEVLASLGLQDYLQERLKRDQSDQPVLLIIDQFEEILTYDPHSRQPKIEFFSELASLLEDRRYWCLLSMREDYLGAMEPYLALLPTGFTTRFRLDLLAETGAIEAIQKPAENAGGPDKPGVNFHDTAAQALFKDLSEVTILSPDGTVQRQPGNFVEPVQLQVVCNNLWNNLQPHSGDEITEKNVSQEGYVDATLGDYFALKVRDAAQVEVWETLGIHSEAETANRQVEVSDLMLANERKIRDWFERYLITGQKIRSQVMMSYPLTPPETGIPNRAIWNLAGAYLVRAESRRGLTFFELAHDRLVRPVLDNNKDWRADQAAVFDAQARAWQESGRAESLLLIGPALVEAESWWEELTKDSLLSPLAVELITASRSLRQHIEEQARPPEISLSERGLNLEEVGWGVIFSANLPPKVRYALSPLLAHRWHQATKKKPGLYREFTYLQSPDETGSASAQQFLRLNGAIPGLLNPEKVPYYLLIVASPQEISFEFQYGLDDAQYAVGRLYFETADEYFDYARSVIAIEQGQAAPPAFLTLATAQPPGDSNSQVVGSALLEPLARGLSQLSIQGWLAEAEDPLRLNKDRLVEIFNTPIDTPGLLFLAAPTPVVDRSPLPADPGWVGAIQVGPLENSTDLPSPAQSFEAPEKPPDPASALFRATDISDRATLLGMVAFFYGSNTGGTSRFNDYSHRLTTVSTANLLPPASATAQIAPLPQRLLGHPNGGALAVFAHIERAGAYAFPQESQPEEYTLFLEILRRLMLGYTAGEAKNLLDQRYSRFLAQIGESLSLSQPAPLGVVQDPEQRRRLSNLLTDTINARNYILLGDPAVFIPPAMPPTETTASRPGRQLPAQAYCRTPENSSGINLRAAASIQSPRLAIAPPGALFEVEETSPDQEWIKVRWFTWQDNDAGQTGLDYGWLAVRSLEGTDAAPPETVPEPVSTPVSLQVVDLEMILSPGPDPAADLFTAEVNISLPGSDAVTTIPRTSIRLDLTTLFALRQDPNALGEALSQGLFSPVVLKDGLARAQAGASSLGVSLRMRLLIDPSLPRLQSLPWELLRDPQADIPLVTGENLLFYRFLWGASWRPLSLRPRADLAALIAIAGWPELSQAKGQTPQILASLQQALDPLVAASRQTILLGESSGTRALTLGRLAATINQGFDILILACPVFDPDGMAANLRFLMKDHAGDKSNSAEAQKLALTISKLPPEKKPRLVVLLTLPDQIANQPEAQPASLPALAPGLAQAGVSAILAFQSPFTSGAVQDFLAPFLQELSNSGQADRAIANIRRSTAKGPDWWTGALFSRQKDGQIWPAGEGLSRGPVAHPGQPVYIGLPEPASSTISRPVLMEEVVKHLTGTAFPTSTVALIGLPGSGKTSLAVAAAYHKSVQEAFPDGVLFETLAENPDLKLILERWMGALTGQSRVFGTLEEASRALSEALAERRMLLILDDVFQAAHLQPFLTSGPGCRRLITTNDRSILPENTQTIRADQMEPGEAVQVLGAGLPPEEQPFLAPLAKQLGYWSLALIIANQLLQRYLQPGRSLQIAVNYLLNDIAERGLAALSIPGAAPGQGNLIDYLRVNLLGLNPEERSALDTLAIFPTGEAIPVDTVLRLWRIQLRLDEALARTRLERLWNLSLVDMPDLNAPALLLPPLLGRYLADSLGSRLGELHTALLEIYGVKRWTQWAAEEPYIWDHVAYHLVKAGQASLLAELLLNPKWLQARLHSAGMGSLLQDFTFLREDASLQVVSRALRQSAFQLKENPQQLNIQLLGRLLGFAETDPRIRGLLEQIRREAAPGILPLNAALNPPDGAYLCSLPFRIGNAACSAITADGRSVLAARDELNLSVWDPDTWTVVHLLAHSSPIQAVSVLPDPARPQALVITRSGLILWDLATGQLLQQLSLTDKEENLPPEQPASGLVTSPDGKWAAACLANARAILFDLTAWTQAGEIAELPATITALTFSGADTLLLGLANGEIQAFKVPGPTHFQSWPAAPVAIARLAASSDGQVVYAASAPGIPAEDLSAGIESGQANANSEISIWKLEGEDGAGQATGEKYYRPYRGLGTFIEGSQPAVSRTLLTTFIGNPIAGLAVTRDGRMALSIDPSGALTVHTISPDFSRYTLQTIQLGQQYVQSLDVSADGTRLVCASADGQAAVWDLALAMRSPASIYRMRAAGISANDRLAVTLDDYGFIKTWDLENWLVEGLSKGRLLRTISPVGGIDVPAGWFFSGQHLVTVSSTGRWCVWDQESGTLLADTPGQPDSRLVDLQVTAGGSASLWTLPVDAGPTGNDVNPPSESSAVQQSTRSPDQNAQGSAGNCVFTFIQPAEGSPAFSTAAIFDPDVVRRSLLLNCRLHILQAHDGQVNAWVRLLGGEREVSADADGRITVWHTADGSQLASLSGHNGPVLALAAFPASARLLSAGSDGTLRIWDLDHLEEIETYHAESALLACAVSTSERLLLAGGSNNTLHILEYTSAALPEQMPSESFKPAYRFLWQNPVVRSLVYPGRESVLRDFLFTMENIDYQAATAQTAQRKFSERSRLAADWGVRTVELKRMAHDDLLGQLLERFERQPDRHPDWLKVLMIHYAGLRSGAAHGSWADPELLLPALEEIALERLKEPDFRRRVQEDYQKSGLKSAARPSRKEKGGSRSGSARPVQHTEAQLLAYLLSEDRQDTHSPPEWKVYDRLLASRLRLNMPDWFWREVVRLTDLRLAIASGDWLTDWEVLTSNELEQRTQPENRLWQAALEKWLATPQQWRAAHRQSFAPLVTRALSSDLADLVYHLRGLDPGYTLAGRAAWLDSETAKREFATIPVWFKRLEELSDLRPGASLLRLAWQDVPPYPWDLAKRSPGVELLDLDELRRRAPSWEITVNEAGVYTRRQASETRSGFRLYKTARQAAPADQTPQTLAWASEAIVIETVVLDGEPQLFTFEAAPQAGLKRTSWKQLQKESGLLWVGYVPEQPLTNAWAERLASLWRGAAAQPSASPVPPSELRPPENRPTARQDLVKTLSGLPPASRRLLVLLASGYSLDQASAALGELFELGLKRLQGMGFLELHPTLLAELLASADLGPDQPHSSP